MLVEVPRAGLEHVDHEVGVALAARHFARGALDRVGLLALESRRLAVHGRRRGLDEPERLDETPRHPRPLIGKFSRARWVCAP
jgi:hypothetical protein